MSAPLSVPGLGASPDRAAGRPVSARDHLYGRLAERCGLSPQEQAVGGLRGLLWHNTSFAQFGAAVDGLSAGLAACGVGEGDHVGLWLSHGDRAPLFYFALWRLGAIAVPFDRAVNAAAAAAIVARVSPRLIVTPAGEQRPDWIGQAPARSEDEMLCAASAPASTKAWRVPAQEVALIVFTSGTTGEPKGVELTHANLISQIDAITGVVPLGPGCRTASLLPLSHMFEQTCGMLYPLLMGAQVNYVPSRRAPDILYVLRTRHVTHMTVVPQLIDAVASSAESQLRAALPAWLFGALWSLAPRLPLSLRRLLFLPLHRKLGGQLGFLLCGGAALPQAAADFFARIGVRVVEGYGASEASPVIACGDYRGTTPRGWVGKALPGVSVRLSDEGELLVRGPNIMRGYFLAPERTADVLRDGWYATGDLAEMDGAGNIRIKGRSRDMIALPSGMNIWPSDIEEALGMAPEIAGAVVLAVPKAQGGVGVHAYLLPASRAARAHSPADLARRATATLAPYQRVSSASWWPEEDFPRTALGKVRRALVPLPTPHGAAPATHTQGAEESVPARDTGEDSEAAASLLEHAVYALVAHEAGKASVQSGQSLGELGFDSLSLTELVLALEDQMGLALSEDGVTGETTVTEVCALLLAAEKEGARGGQGSGPPRGTEHSTEKTAPQAPRWIYTGGRVLRPLALPFDLLYRAVVPQTIISGEEHLRAAWSTQRLIIAGTHRGFADIPLLREALRRVLGRRSVRELVVATGAGTFASGGWLARYVQVAFGLYPLRQKGAQEESLRGLAELAARGRRVVLFPQGRHTTPGEEGRGEYNARFRSGVGYLASSLDASVVPFGQAGTDRIMPPQATAHRGLVVGGVPVALVRTPLVIVFGPALEPGEGENAAAFAGRLQVACVELSRQAREIHARAGRQREVSIHGD